MGQMLFVFLLEYEFFFNAMKHALIFTRAREFVSEHELDGPKALTISFCCTKFRPQVKIRVRVQARNALARTEKQLSVHLVHHVHVIPGRSLNIVTDEPVAMLSINSRGGKPFLPILKYIV